MPEVTYTDVVWTAGDVITEAKMDNMVANDRAVDAMNNGIRLDERSNPSTPSTNTLHIFGKDKNGISTLYVINDAGTVYEIAESTPTYIFPIQGPLTLQTNVVQLPVIKDSVITRAFAYAATPPVGADVIFDINKNGSTIWSTQANRLKILANASTGSQTTFDTTALTQDDILSIDVDQIGSSTSGSDIVVYIKTK